jgi:hypothetical protein
VLPLPIRSQSEQIIDELCLPGSQLDEVTGLVTLGDAAAGLNELDYVAAVRLRFMRHAAAAL